MALAYVDFMIMCNKDFELSCLFAACILGPVDVDSLIKTIKIDWLA